MASHRDFIQAAKGRRRFLGEQLALLNAEEQRYQADATRLRSALERTRRELAGYLVPDLDDDDLAAAERRFRYPGLLAIKRDYEERLRAGEARRVELSQMDEIVNHVERLAEVEEQLALTVPVYERVEARWQIPAGNPWFEELSARGYFEPTYDPGFLARIRDWRAVSFLLDALDDAHPELDDPESLREWYLKLRDERLELGTLLATYRERRDRLVALKAEHGRLVDQPQRLLTELQAALGEALREHLWACPEALRLELVKEDPALVTFLKKEIGLEKQIAYLEELRVARIASQQADLKVQMGKVDRKLAKARAKGPRKTYTGAEMASMRQTKAESWAKRHARLGAIRERVAGFDRWERGSLVADFLWWDLVTKGARGDDLYEVRSFRRTHPDFSVAGYADPLAPGRELAQGVLMAGAARELVDRMTTSAARADRDIS